MKDRFVIAIASGKGGTGKTTVATNLAHYLAALGQKVQYLDCDVEEPNGQIFLKPKITATCPVSIDIPHVDAQKCTACGRCGEICQYNAIICIKEHVLTFDELCHSCAGCWRICPADAIRPRPLNIGEIELGSAGDVHFVGGRLRIGSVRTVSLIKEVKKYIQDGHLTIVDVPPGTSCPVVEALKDADFVLLVTEPTPFGLNDLKLAVGLVREMKLPFGVVINRCGIGNDEVEKYCKAQNIEIVMRLPDDRRIAEEYSSGRMIVNIFAEYRKRFEKLCEHLQTAKEQLYEKRRLRIRRKNIS
ncbi:MAG TPA: ATP-binding protein [Sedimentisphaerales bacterium]|nr:ATP-binding protein [Sedimentisphaerales bacterium]